MTQSNPTLLQAPTPYERPQLRSLPLSEQPAYRITRDASACNLTELLAAVIGGQRQIEISQDLLSRFDGSLRRLYQAHPAELRGCGASARPPPSASRPPWRWACA